MEKVWTVSYVNYHRGPTQSVCVADCYFIGNVLDLPFASPIAIYQRDDFSLARMNLATHFDRSKIVRF